jgi:hypothetical protein
MMAEASRAARVVTVESRSSEKPSWGARKSPSNQTHNGRQKHWMPGWVKRWKKPRTVSAPGQRGSPSNACNARSARAISVCAKRRAPTTTPMTKAVNAWPGGMALGLVNRHGRCAST